jgi:hypothetical protein
MKRVQYQAVCRMLLERFGEPISETKSDNEDGIDCMSCYDQGYVKYKSFDPEDPPEKEPCECKMGKVWSAKQNVKRY